MTDRLAYTVVQGDITFGYPSKCLGTVKYSQGKSSHSNFTGLTKADVHLSKTLL
jgi:hypothetical protein